MENVREDSLTPEQAGDLARFVRNKVPSKSTDDWAKELEPAPSIFHKVKGEANDRPVLERETQASHDDELAELIKALVSKHTDFQFEKHHANTFFCACGATEACKGLKKKQKSFHRCTLCNVTMCNNCRTAHAVYHFGDALRALDLGDIISATIKRKIASGEATELLKVFKHGKK